MTPGVTGAGQLEGGARAVARRGAIGRVQAITSHQFQPPPPGSRWQSGMAWHAAPPSSQKYLYDYDRKSFLFLSLLVAL